MTHPDTPQALISMQSSHRRPRLTARQKLLIKLMAFLGVALLLLYIRPKVEAWVESRQQRQQTANEPTDKSSQLSSPYASPWKKTASSERPSEVSEGPVQFEVRAENSAATKSEEPISKTAPVPSSPKTTDSAGRKSSVTKMNRTEPAQRRVPDDAEKSNPPPAKNDVAAKSTLGKLNEIDDNVFESTAGLVYLPGSTDGHRLRHVMEHSKDNTSKEIHGIYDGNRDEILAVIDEAFMKAKKGGTDVRSEIRNGRRVYTVNLKRRIGQMGGRQGERQGNPDCRYVRLVLENDVEVVTAYPTKSF